MNSTILKETILKAMTEALKKDPQIIAAWLGGSKATGFEDTLSDIDIVMICENAERPFEILDEALSSLHKISQKWSVEDSPFKGLHQKFYTLEGTPETFYVDAGVYTSLKADTYREYYNPSRHGTPWVLFDKTGVLAEAAQSPKMESPAIPDLENFNARFEIIRRTFLKESLRGKYIDSFLFYQRLVLMLVQMLRLVHSPQKFDFGLRYLERDLPSNEFRMIERLLKSNDIETLQKNAREIQSKIFELQKKHFSS